MQQMERAWRIKVTELEQDRQALKKYKLDP